MAEPTLEQVQEEMRRQGIPVSTESIMDERGTTSGEFLKGFEALAKGIPKGVLNMIGGLGNLYDLATKSKDPNVFSTAGLARLIKDAVGIDILTIPGYRGVYEFGEAGAPAAVPCRAARCSRRSCRSRSADSAAECGPQRAAAPTPMPAGSRSG